MTRIVLIAHNLRSSHNAGSLLRTAEGLGVEHVYLTGYTPYPVAVEDKRLPHVAIKVDKQIQKTALGAQHSQAWTQSDDIETVFAALKNDGFTLYALEQSEKSVPLPELTVPSKVALVVGREVEGIEPSLLAICDEILEIPMFGKKESFNVVQAAAMALYQCRFRG